MVDFNKIDYRAIDSIRLLNQFEGVITYESCTGHLQSNQNGKISRYISGLVRENDELYLDKKLITHADAENLFINGLVDIDRAHVEIRPITDLIEAPIKTLPNLYSTYSILRFKEFPHPFCPLTNNLRKVKTLSRNLDVLYYKNAQSLGLIRLGTHGFKIEGIYMTQNELTKYFVEALVKKQEKIESFWHQIAETCTEILNEPYARPPRPKIQSRH